MSRSNKVWNERFTHSDETHDFVLMQADVDDVEEVTVKIVAQPKDESGSEFTFGLNLVEAFKLLYPKCTAEFAKLSLQNVYELA
jgi:hypothetical protein